MKQGLAICMLLVCLVPDIGHAQEANYNTFQVGSRSALMGGAVVAGVRDTSATFYNPAALSFIENPSISVSANAFRFGSLTINDALGEGQDSQATLLEPVPLLISGMLRLQTVPDWTLGYTILTRKQYSGNFRDRLNDERRESFSFLGQSFNLPARVVAQANTSSQANELWAMGAASWRVNKTLAVGIAPIVTVRRQSRIDRFSLATIPDVEGGGLLPIGVNTVTALHDGSVQGVFRIPQFGGFLDVPLFGAFDGTGAIAMVSPDFFFSFIGRIAGGRASGELETAGGFRGTWQAVRDPSVTLRGNVALHESRTTQEYLETTGEVDSGVYQPVPSQRQPLTHAVHNRVSW